MKILFPVAECVPFAKTGGLADVAGALPHALAALGHEVHVVMPLYRSVLQSTLKPKPTGRKLLVPIGNDMLNSEVWEVQYPNQGPIVHFLQEDNFFDRSDLYRNPSGGYPDNDRRFMFLCRGALELGVSLGVEWDIVHCHDWHTGLVPVFLKHLYQKYPAYRKTRCLMTVHNLAYQGHFDYETFVLAGLPPTLFTAEGIEFWGGLNFLKSGLMLADWISTVSPTYAEEIQTPEYGCGLEGVLLSRQDRLSGILNGIDYTVWNPAQDPHLQPPFDAANPAAKQAVKAALLESIGLYPLEKAPLIGMISRLDDQKGCDLIAASMEGLMQENLQLIVLGTGEKKYHDLFLRFKAKYPRRLSLHLEFNERTAHRIYGGADMFLMPSKYEPCGLGQLISMRYGTIPIVRQTGGLADTVIDHPQTNANGFAFSAYSGEALLAAVKRACQVYAEPKIWKKLVKNSMEADFSWDKSAQQYEALYQKMIGKKA